jgi:hypothetical protein
MWIQALQGDGCVCSWHESIRILLCWIGEVLWQSARYCNGKKPHFQNHTVSAIGCAIVNEPFDELPLRTLNIPCYPVERDTVAYACGNELGKP